MTEFDYVLVGGGLQNGLIAGALRMRQPESRIALVERAGALGIGPQEALQQEEYPLEFLGGEEGTVPIEATEAETGSNFPVDGAGGEVE